MGEVVRLEAHRSCPARPWAGYRVTRIDDPDATIAELEEPYLKRMRDRDSQSLGEIRCVLDRHVIPSLGPLRLSDIDPDEAAAWTVWMHKASGLSQSRIDVILWVVRGLVDVAVPGALPLNPFRIMRPDIKRVRKLNTMARQVLAIEAASRFISSAELPLERQALVATPLFTGARPAEVLGLQWRDWDRSAEPMSRLTIERQWVRKELRYKPRKTGEPTQAPVVEDYAVLLFEWRQVWREKFGRDPTATDPIFPRYVRSPGRARPVLRPIDEEDMRDEFNEDLVRLGITMPGDRRRFHSLRHTFLTLLPASGAPEAVVFSLTHAPDRSIRSVYRHVLWLMQCEALERHPVRLVRPMQQRTFPLETTPAPAPAADPPPATRRPRRRRRAVQLPLFSEST